MWEPCLSQWPSKGVHVSHTRLLDCLFSFFRIPPCARPALFITNQRRRLYPQCPWEDKQIRRLIGDGKVAARLKGLEVRRAETDTECPICFLHYAQVNQTKCCQASLCTECYLQVRPPKEKVVCPFCNASHLSVSLAQTLSREAIREREAEEQRAIEASIRSRGGGSSHHHHSNHNNDSNSKADAAEEQAPDGGGGFGAAMEQDATVALMRQRSNSLSEAAENLSSVAMTVTERQALEDRLRTQQNSPLIQRMQQEELERAFRNERDYMEQNAGRVRRRHYTGAGGSRPPRLRDFNRMMAAFEEGGIQSLDDLIMLEAAMRMTLNSDAEGGEAAAAAASASPLRRRMLGASRGAPPPAPSFLGGSNIASQLIMRGLSEEEQLAMAIAASLETPSTPADSTTSHTSEAAATTEVSSEQVTLADTHENNTAVPSASSTDSPDAASTAVSSFDLGAEAVANESLPVSTDPGLTLLPAPSGAVEEDQPATSEEPLDATNNVDVPSEAPETQATNMAAAVMGGIALNCAPADRGTTAQELGGIALNCSPADRVDFTEQPDVLNAPVMAQTGLPISEVIADETNNMPQPALASETRSTLDKSSNQLLPNVAVEDSNVEKLESVEENMIASVEGGDEGVQESKVPEVISLETKLEEELTIEDDMVVAVESSSSLPSATQAKSIETSEPAVSRDAQELAC